MFEEATREEKYITSRCAVAICITNQNNDANRITQSISKGHSAILPVDPAHELAEYCGSLVLGLYPQIGTYRHGIFSFEQELMIFGLAKTAEQDFLTDTLYP